MSSGPLPPHERSWRHPSELVGAPPPPPPPSSRMWLLSSAAIAVVCVGVLALALTPRRSGGDGSARVGTPELQFDASRPSEQPPVRNGAEVDAATRPYVVTPVGPGYGLTTRAAVTPAATPRVAELPSGEQTESALIAEVGPMAVVSIPGVDQALPLGVAPDVAIGDSADDAPGAVTAATSASSATNGRAVGTAGIATVPAADGDGDGDGEGDEPTYYVIAGGSTMPLSDPGDVDALTALSTPEGAPVIDAEGQLVGLVTHAGDNGTATVLSVTTGLDLAPPAAGPATTVDEPVATADTTVAVTTIADALPTTTVADSDVTTVAGDLPPATSVPATTASPGTAASPTTVVESSLPTSTVAVTSLPDEPLVVESSLPDDDQQAIDAADAIARSLAVQSV